MVCTFLWFITEFNFLPGHRFSPIARCKVRSLASDIPSTLAASVWFMCNTALTSSWDGCSASQMYTNSSELVF